jgi:hypothetical protein
VIEGRAGQDQTVDVGDGDADGQPLLGLAGGAQGRDPVDPCT